MCRKKNWPPADVAKDGYDALMKGEGMVISGIKNKIQVAISNVLPDDMVAEKVHHQQAPKGENKNS